MDDPHFDYIKCALDWFNCLAEGIGVYALNMHVNEHLQKQKYQQEYDGQVGEWLHNSRETQFTTHKMIEYEL